MRNERIKAINSSHFILSPFYTHRKNEWECEVFLVDPLHQCVLCTGIVIMLAYWIRHSGLSLAKYELKKPFTFGMFSTNVEMDFAIGHTKCKTQTYNWLWQESWKIEIECIFARATAKLKHQHPKIQTMETWPKWDSGDFPAWIFSFATLMHSKRKNRFFISLFESAPLRGFQLKVIEIEFNAQPEMKSI